MSEKIQNNRLKSEIEEILSLCQQLEDEGRTEFLPAATEEEITEWERQNRITIPESYKDWLRFSNGSIILGSLAYLYSLKEIKVDDKEYPLDYVAIGEAIGDGVRICFSKSTGDFIWYDHGSERKFENFGKVLDKITLMM